MLKKIFNYNEFAEKMFEQAISIDVINRFENYLNEEDQQISQNVKKEIKNLKNILRNISFEDIIITKNKKIDDVQLYKVSSYTKEIETISSLINNILQNIIDKDLREIMIEYYEENIKNLYVELEIEYDNLNRIHVPDGLPVFMQGIGLTQKIYKAIMKKIGYISSEDNKGYLNYAIKGIWENLAQDTDCYTILMTNRIICFNINCKQEIIKDTITKLFKENTQEYTIDPDLIKMYPDMFDENILNNSK